MEGYTNISGNGSHEDFDDFDLEGRNRDDRKSKDRKLSAKQESVQEEQKRLLELKVKLDDGGYGYVFSLKLRDSSWRWRCHLCDVIIVGQTHVETHIQSKKHQVKMAVKSHDRDLFTRIEGEDCNSVNAVMDIAPGEPVPPGFEDTIGHQKGVAQIQATLDCHKSSPLIGLEYLVELVPDERDKEPMYICVLCDKKGDPRVAMAHLTSFNHRSKYIGINFPTANRAINSSLPRTKEGRRGVAEIVTRICSKIEAKHGRLMPLVVGKEAYELKKDFYNGEIEKDRHFRETPEENYMDLVDTDVLQPYSINLDDVPLPIASAVKKEDTKRKISVDRSRLRLHSGKESSSKESDKEDKHIEADAIADKKKSDKKVASFDKAKKLVPRRSSLSSISSVSSSSLSRSPSPTRTRSKSRTPSSSPPLSLSKGHSAKSKDRYGRRSSSRHGGGRWRRRSRSRSPRYLSRRSRSRGRRSRSKSRSISRCRYRNKPLMNVSAEKQKWEKFRVETDKIERDLIKTLKFHEKNPEKHPMYPEEWKKFWNSRYKELQAEGIDPAKHDFKPEWIGIWNKRMKEMHEELFKSKREDLRLRLELPKEDPPTRNKNVAYFPKKQVHTQVLDDDIIIISPPGDVISKSNWKNDRKRSLSPWDKNDPYPHKSSRKWSNTRSYNEGSSSNRSNSYKAPPEAYDDPPPDDTARVITCLRLLTAMENQLGSIGPSINKLLGTAIAMEKSHPGASESLLGNPDNLVLFETVKEKLKGQLFAGIVESGLVLATRSCVQNLAAMIYRAEKMPKELEKPLVVPKAPVMPMSVVIPKVTVSGIGAMDKASIAVQIAALLVQQGRANVSQAELEDLINSVVLGKSTSEEIVELQPKPEPPVVLEEKSPLQKLLSVVQFKPLMESTNLQGVQSCLFPSAIAPAPEPQRVPSPLPARMNLTDMEELTEADLQALLQNFKDLSTEEQYCLITYLKKIEAKEPDRVENLRQFVNLAPPVMTTAVTLDDKPSYRSSGRLSPFSLRLGQANPSSEQSNKQLKINATEAKLDDLDSDDDYSFDDICVAASKKVNEREKADKDAKDLIEKETQDAFKILADSVEKDKIAKTEPAPIPINDDHLNILRETKLMIANLMGELPGKFIQKKTSTPSPQVAKPSTPSIAEPIIRPNLGLNIDISNTLIDAESNFPQNSNFSPTKVTKDVPKVTLNSANIQSVIDDISNIFPIASKAEAFPIASKAQAFPIASKAQAFPIATKAQAFPIATKAQAFPIATKAQALPISTVNVEAAGSFINNAGNASYDPSFPSEAGHNYNDQYDQHTFQGDQYAGNAVQVQPGNYHNYQNQQYPQGFQGSYNTQNYSNYYTGQQQHHQQQQHPYQQQHANGTQQQPIVHGYPQHSTQMPNAPSQSYPNQYGQQGVNQYNHYNQGYY